ncbi:MAG TPA: anthrone oxygenase family protein [Solirubrobacteraceae bacterium]|nr:anthrone oxygenase family protein [Solirubrobacteraceae bacterium]
MLSRALAVSTVVLVGLLAGGMVLIRILLVPFWRGAPPAEFRDWFAAHSGRIRALMLPLGAGAGVAAAASAVAEVVESRGSAPAAAAAAGATAGVVAITITVNEPANSRFTGGGLTDDETAELLGRWARWHDVRVVLGLAGTLAAALALTQRDA